MKNLAILSLGTLTLMGSANLASAGWDDSYAYCCGFHAPRYYFFSGPGYFDHNRYGYRRWYRGHYRTDADYRRRHVRRHRQHR
jgi:hypothetical protein